MPTEDAQLSLHHFGNGRPCRFFNQYSGGCLSGPTCPFMHAPDEHSLRLKLDGGNICEAQLVRLGGCPKGTSCWYSHDLENGAGFPVDDAWALKETMERIVRMRKEERRQVGLQGSFVKPRGDGPSALVLKGKTGDDILKELGGRRPAGNPSRIQHSMRYAPYTPPVPGGPLDEEPPMPEEMKSMFAPPPSSKPRVGKGKARGGARPPRGGAASRPAQQPRPRSPSPERGSFGWTRAQEDELMMQGVKPWDNDAADVLAVLGAY